MSKIYIEGFLIISANLLLVFHIFKTIIKEEIKNSENREKIIAKANQKIASNSMDQNIEIMKSFLKQ